MIRSLLQDGDEHAAAPGAREWQKRRRFIETEHGMSEARIQDFAWYLTYCPAGNTRGHLILVYESYPQRGDSHEDGAGCFRKADHRIYSHRSRDFDLATFDSPLSARDWPLHFTHALPSGEARYCRSAKTWSPPLP